MRSCRPYKWIHQTHPNAPSKHEAKLQRNLMCRNLSLEPRWVFTSCNPRTWVSIEEIRSVRAMFQHHARGFKENHDACTTVSVENLIQFREDQHTHPIALKWGQRTSVCTRDPWGCGGEKPLWLNIKIAFPRKKAYQRRDVSGVSKERRFRCLEHLTGLSHKKSRVQGRN